MRIISVFVIGLFASSPAFASPSNIGASAPAGSSRPALIAQSRAEDARIALRELRRACASERRRDVATCRRGLAVLAEAREEMLARRAATAAD